MEESKKKLTQKTKGLYYNVKTLFAVYTPSLSFHLLPSEYVLNNSFSQHSKDVTKEFYVLNIIKRIRHKISNSITQTHKEKKKL